MDYYSNEFADGGNVNWLPYMMYFHPFNFRSEVVNTDGSGFRYSTKGDQRYSATDMHGLGSCHLIAGSSTVFGIGASADSHTLASRLSEHDPRGVPWVNFGGRSFNSTQEMILFSLYRHRLPEVESVTILSGFNDLGLARLPKRVRLDNGAFFMCNEFYEAMAAKKQSRFSKWFGEGKLAEPSENLPSLDEQIDYAVALTLRNLSNWKAMCTQMDAMLTFVLQPLSSWVRPIGCDEEEALFEERERHGGFAEQYGDILSHQTYETYRDRLREGAQAIGVPFTDLTEHLQGKVASDFWLFVDRIHFTNQGHDLVSRILLESVAKVGEPS
ncbi:GDSL-type esterase/lipase family protein [uncultured Tateyamaria sp.]|uniref:GDSL-type esterase/lipase family protein n=1 Tax=uncultured Tateyamaria sp. TaxID=455651 RepID=UPI002620E575|nr:GDSL-type esterase/lipase family protein [uncultured Tateyamaria sp.]